VFKKTVKSDTSASALTALQDSRVNVSPSISGFTCFVFLLLIAAAVVVVVACVRACVYTGADVPFSLSQA